MKPVLIVAIFLLAACAVSARKIPSDSLSRIAGGTVVAASAKYPYQVSLRVYFKHFCGGSVINSRWILTAAHCLTGRRPDQISVIGGTNLLSEAGNMYQAIYKIVHPQYDSVKKINDVALILVGRDISFADKVQPIVLPASNAGDNVNSRAIFTGWGSATVDGDFSNKLRQLEETIISQTECAKQTTVGTNQICALSKTGSSSCNGDGGGPLVVGGVQVGISVESTACVVGKPDVFTKVSSYVDWINKTIKDHKGPQILASKNLQ